MVSPRLHVLWSELKAALAKLPAHAPCTVIDCSCFQAHSWLCCRGCGGYRARSQDDARDTFKTLKNQHIGDSSAHLYYEWAVLEHSAGNVSKALGIIARGMRADAQPLR